MRERSGNVTRYCGVALELNTRRSKDCLGFIPSGSYEGAYATFLSASPLPKYR